MAELILDQEAVPGAPAGVLTKLFSCSEGGIHLITAASDGEGQLMAVSEFRLNGNGGAIGAAIADYFGANSAFSITANGVYELEAHIWYLKTTAGTVTYTITNTANYTDLVAWYEQSAVGGIGTNAAPTGAGVVTTTAAAAALPVTASLTTLVNHSAVIRALFVNAAGTNVRLRITSSAGTVTPLRGSFMKLTRIHSTNIGGFVA